MEDTRSDGTGTETQRHDQWKRVWAAFSSAEERTVELPLRRAEPGTSFYHLSLEGILNMVTEPGERVERRRGETRTVRHLQPGGDAAELCLFEHRTPQAADEAARAVRVLQKIAGQYADAKRRRRGKRKGLWLTPEEVELWNGLLLRQPALQFHLYDPETHERAEHPGRENQVAGGEGPHPEAVLKTSLYLAAQFLAEVVCERCNERIARCLAPVHPANTRSRATCSRLFVTTTQGGLGQTCSDKCRRRVNDRKRARNKAAREAAQKEAFEALRARRRPEAPRPSK